MQRINGQKDKRVTAMIRGVIKPMNKTYGGSILKQADMSAKTRIKFDTFITNLNI